MSKERARHPLLPNQSPPHEKSSFPFILISAISLIGTTICADPPEQGVWEETFYDDFTGSQLESSRWGKGLGWGDTTGWSREWCTPENVTVADGKLILKLEKRVPNSNPSNKIWAAGCVNTKKHFSQENGYFEARFKIAKGSGFLNAFWMKRITEEWPPEIDIMEIIGTQPSAAHMTMHYDEGKGHQKTGGNWWGPDFSEDFHTFGLWWKKDTLIWYIDGVERRRTTEGVATLTGPFYMMLNVHIGGISWMGDPDAATPNPSFFVTDWVRVSKWIKDRKPGDVVGAKPPKALTAAQSGIQYTKMSSSLKVRFPTAEPRKVSLFTLNGTLIAQQAGFRQEYAFGRGSVAPGIYLVHSTGKSGAGETVKIDWVD